MASVGKDTIGLSWNPKLPSSLPSSSFEKKKEPSRNGLPSSSSSTSLWMAEKSLIDGLFVPPRDPKKMNKIIRKQLKDTAGKKWFDMTAPIVTPELKKDLQLLKLRDVIDPKRHYKKSNSKELPKYFQVGTVIESASDFFSGRLTKKERKLSFADELLSDASLKQFRKRKVAEIEKEHSLASGVKKWQVKKNARKRKKQI